MDGQGRVTHFADEPLLVLKDGLVCIFLYLQNKNDIKSYIAKLYNEFEEKFRQLFKGISGKCLANRVFNYHSKFP